MLGLASRRWAVNKLCQTFSIKAFRADNSENIWQIIIILLKENYSGEWHYYFLYANEVNICQPRVLCWYPPAQRLALWLTAGPELPEWLSWVQTTTVMLTSEARQRTSVVKYNVWTFPCQIYPLGYENHYSKDIVTQNMRALLIASLNPGWDPSVECNMY